MGAQNYAEQIAVRTPQALKAASALDWGFRRLDIRSLRSELAGNRRLPIARVARAPERVRRAIGRALYAGDRVTHRTSLELPPAPEGDCVTLHDVIAWRFADESAPVAAAQSELRRAAAVICVSEFTANEAYDLLGLTNLHVAHNGVESRFFHATPFDAHALARYGITQPFVLHAGGASARKNLDALAVAWPRVRRERPDLQLVLSGPPHPRREYLFRRLTGTVIVGHVPNDDVPGLVAAANAVVVPSLYEGFGLPVLEAMAAGVPVVAAATSSIPEVAGDAAILVEPTGAGIAQGLLDAVSSDDAVADLVRAGKTRASEFTWERSALEHARVWASIGS
ncbi:glycosyltransferase [Microbacterium lacus]|uniref:glycosyltransferase n=1 Tax=Microbacterium lacus TaxID=415217 RepID=UPI00384EB3AF